MDVDDEGHVTVMVDENPWIPPAPGGVLPEGQMGRWDVPWILDRLLAEHGGPLKVVLHDGGRVFSDTVTRDRLAYLGPRPTDRPKPPGGPTATPATMPPGSPSRLGRPSPGWFEAGGYTPGEQVAVAVIVTRLSADEHGGVGFTLPAALRAMVGDVVAIGEDSREIYVNQADREPATLRAIRDALNSPTASGPKSRPRAGLDDLNHAFRRPAGGPELSR
ncbi:hypothetical protein EDD34_1936 [Myceligenerans xiligouense]|uniref:Uncharacterized protein n=2 Tax=Myceligenerans xiligouense TaxID=253184 RepID=A0A3N4ZN64_9MICO|nr:hypothetical protein EDD34_1936 [Myceligenerans xiligouense]